VLGYDDDDDAAGDRRPWEGGSRLGGSEVRLRIVGVGSQGPPRHEVRGGVGRREGVGGGGKEWRENTLCVRVARRRACVPGQTSARASTHARSFNNVTRGLTWGQGARGGTGASEAARHDDDAEQAFRIMDQIQAAHSVPDGAGRGDARAVGREQVALSLPIYTANLNR
jgi:hypothetical protein